jgi:hypothetical protein
MRNNIPLNKNPLDIELILKSHSNKLNDYIGEVASLIYSIYSCNELCRINLFNWIYSFISYNLDKLKLYQNNPNLSTMGSMLNVLAILLKIFFDQQIYLKIDYPVFIFKAVSEIDPLFTLSSNRINFGKIFERINSALVKEIIVNESDEYNYKEYNLNTELFFIINTMISLTVKNFDEDLIAVSNKIDDMYRNGQTGEQLYKDSIVIEKATTCYTKNPEINKNMIRFLETSAFFLFALNNKKYPQINLQKGDVNYVDFLEDFYNYIDISDNFALSLLPESIIKNIIHSSLFIRKYSSDSLMLEYSSTKAVVYFSLIFSSHVDLIKNPHLRADILDILIYIFVVYQSEKNSKISSIFKLINEHYIKNSLLFSLMRVFIDAERLGTSNQFYEKFSVRHKILYMIENVMKANKSLFLNKIVEYANNYNEDASKMINLLMNDITFLNDECIERLMDIKRYEDLVDDVNKYKITLC